MPNLTTSADVDAFMAAANNAAARTSLGLTTLATTTPGTGVATALGVNIGSAGAPVLFNGAGGTPSSITLTNGTSLPIGTGVSGLGTGIATALGTNTGSAGSVVVFNGAGGTPSSINLSNGVSLPISTGVSGLGTGVATFLATPSSANLASAVTGEVGSGALVFGTSPTFTTSVVTDSTTLAMFNTVATTVNAFGATTTLNIGASAATVLNFGGFTSAAELRFLEPSGSGTNYSGLKQPALAASITYLLPSDAPANGDVLTSQSNGTLSWEAPSGSANAVTAASAAGSSGLFWVSGGADRTATATDTVSTANITTANVGAIVASGATIALLNTVATTVNAFGAATTINIGTSATVLNFGGGATAAEFRFLEPSGSGTNYTAIKAQAQSANITYTLPATVGGAGTFLTDAAGNGTLSWATPGGSGTVTVVGAGSLTSTALVTGGGTTTLQTPSATSTLDSSGNMALAGSATATRFIPSGSTVPTNGLYLPAANTLGWAINSAAEMQLTATALSPAVDGGNSLGTTALGWQNLFGNTGFVINIENSDWVATHTTGIVTIGTGTLKITTPTNNANSVLTTDGTQTVTNKSIVVSQLTAGVLGGTITLGESTGNIKLDQTLSADGTWSGITVDATAGYTQAFGDCVYLDPTDSRWELCDANSASGADGDSRGTVGMVVVAGTDGNACTILLRGKIRADAKFPTFTVNNPVYISETAGSVTQTQPTTTDVVIRIIGAALTADELLFMPDNMWITHT